MTEAIYLEVTEMAETAHKAKRQVSVSGMLKHLGVSRSGYHAWLKRVPSNTEKRREAVKAKIKDIYDESKQNYGAPKITRELRKSGEIISERTVGKYMKQMGVKAQWIKPWTITTKDSDFSSELKNILDEQFNPERPNAVWCSDITYIWTIDGFVYLTSIMDLYSRKIIAWTLSQKAYNGENMSKYGDVVVVTVNHRLNILGYLDLSQYGEKYADSANAGQEDLIAALKWIKENIKEFGGNPQNVTIFGQSGGGMKVSGLMQMKEADGLFQKGIIMSGVPDKSYKYSDKDSTPLITALLEELNFTEDEVEKLEYIPYAQLAQAYNKVSPKLEAEGEYVGCTPKPNDFYKGEGPDVGFRKEATKIPLMIGSVFGEFYMKPQTFFKDEISKEELMKRIGARFGDWGEELSDVFQEVYPEKNLADLLTLDTVFRCPTKKFIKEFAKSGGKIYSYLFTLEFPYQHGKTAWHCSDIPFVFHNTELVPVTNIPEISDKLEKQMFDAVIHFAETGNPNHSGIPQWPVSTEEREATMIFDRVCTVRFNFDDYLLELHKKALPNLTLANIEQEDDQIQH